MEKIKSRIINAEVNDFCNKKTGEINSMTKITYTYPRDNSENDIGPSILVCYRPGNLIGKLKPIISSREELIIELDNRIDERTSTIKKVIKAINNMEV